MWVERRYVAGGGERGREGAEHGHVLLQDLPEELCALLVKALEFLECVVLRCVRGSQSIINQRTKECASSRREQTSSSLGMYVV